MKANVPNILLIGNGINRAYGGDDWKKVLEKLSQGEIQKEYKNIPYPLLAMLLTQGKIGSRIKEHQTLFGGVEDRQLKKMEPILQKILSMKFNHILTTNYSYELERIANPDIKRIETSSKKLHMKHTNAVKQADKIYLLHTYNEVRHDKQIKCIWHIHGEVRKPSSIVLGHYYYANLLGRCQKEVKKSEVKRKKDMECPKSWLEAFLQGNVYCMGFGFDYAESDLWWLLNHKRYCVPRQPTMYYYDVKEVDEEKKQLLEQMGAKIVYADHTFQMNYQEGYWKILEMIEAQMNSEGN